MPKINQEEYEVLKGLGNTWKWIARDKDGVLGVYDAKVVKTKFHNFWVMAIKKKIDLTLFSFIQWENEEPYNITELVEEYESEETEMTKDIKWLKEEISNLYPSYNEIYVSPDYEYETIVKVEIIDGVLELIDQLDEPEVLSQKWIDENKSSWTKLKIDGYYIPVEKLQNLLVPKQKEVDRAYKDGYETGKQHTFYKGYLEGITDKGSEPETVADVVTTFWKSYERLKEVMSMEVEELEE